VSFFGFVDCNGKPRNPEIVCRLAFAARFQLRELAKDEVFAKTADSLLQIEPKSKVFAIYCQLGQLLNVISDASLKGS
jgi:hypothetical protein